MSDFLPAVLAIAVFLSTVVITPRIVTVTMPATLVCVLGLAVYTVFLAAFVASDTAVAFWPVTSLYWFAFLAFLVFFLVVYRSVSLRILGELLDRPSHSAAYDSLFESYVRSETLDARLRFVVDSRRARCSSTGLELTERGRRHGRIVAALQNLFKIDFVG